MGFDTIEINLVTFEIGQLEKLSINHGRIRFKEIRMIIISNSLSLIAHIVLLISLLADIIQKSCCTQDGDMYIIFQMNYVPFF